MRLKIPFAEINTLLAAKGLSSLELSCDGEKLILTAKGAMLHLSQVETSLNRISFAHRGVNLRGKLASGVGVGIAKLFITLPKFISLDSKHLTILWDKLLRQISVHSSRVCVKGSSLLVELEI